MRTPLSHFFFPASLVIVLSILGTSVIAAPIAPPPGGYTGGIFSYYFKNIIEGNGTVGTTSGGVCPTGRVISGFSTAPGTYGLPICIVPTSADGSASSLTGALRGTTNYVPKYGLTNTGIINSQIFDNGINVGIGTITPSASLDITGRTFKVSNLYPEYNWTFGGGTDLNWKKIADITIGSTAYAATSMRVSIIDAMSNYGHSQNMTPLNFYLSARRSGGVVNGLNDGLVAGPISDYVRLVKTGTGAYEVQARTIVNYRNVQVNAQVISSMDSIVTYATSPADGNTTGTIYTPVATNYEYFSNLTVSGSVGVGITSPTTKLQVLGGIRALGGSIFTGANGYTFSSPGDTDGGMYSPADGTLVLATNNTERVRILSNGNIGIGTSTGTAKLTVAVTGGGYVGIRNSGSIGSQIDFNSQGAYIVNNGGSNEILGLNTPTGGNIAFRIGGTERFRLHSNGNVGIGTAAPAARLAVVGATFDSTAAAFTAVNSSGTTLITARNDGNIGIGTAAPGQRLSVAGNALANNYMLNSGDGNGVCFWGNCTTYKISMGNTAEYHYGSVTDYSVKNTMNNATNRGWTWGSNGTTPVAALNTQGNLQIAGQITIAGGTPGSGQVLTSNASGLATWEPINASESDPKVGALTTNYLPKWAGSTLGNSQVFDNGTNVGIGTAVPSALLDVVGDIEVNGLTVGRGSGGLVSNTAIGRLVLGANTTGTANTGIGNVALDANTTGTSNTAIGVNSLTSNTTGNNNVSIGVGALANNITGDSNVAVGVQALTTHTVGIQNTALGQRAAWNQSAGDNNIAIGYNVVLASTTSSNQLNIGNWIYGDNGNIGIGTSANLTAKLNIQGALKITDGTQGSGKILTSDGTGLAKWMDAPGDLPIGTVMAFNDVVCPAGWAVADGTSGTPDLRGEFVRGLDMGRGIDTGRVVGTWQDYMMQSHAHTGTATPAGAHTPSGSANAVGDHRHYNNSNSAGGHSHTMGFTAGESDAGANGSDLRGGGSEVNVGSNVAGAHTHDFWGDYAGGHGHALTMNGIGDHTHGLTIANNGGTETRPRNVALLYCMKITAAGVAGSDDSTWMNVDGTSSGRVVLATSGNVGIGTLTPSEKLDVVGNIRTTGTIAASNNISTTTAISAGTTLSAGTNITAGGTITATGSISTITGQFLTRTADSVTVPGFSWVGDTNMGIYRAAADTLAITTAGVERLRVAANGVITATNNISTTTAISAGTTLSAGTNITAGGTITATGSISTITGQFLTRTADSVTVPGFSWVGDTNMGIYRAAADTLAITTAGVERLRVAANGNIGVGTGVNLTEKLNVQGSIRIVDGYQGTGKVLVSDGTGKGTWKEMPGDLPTGSIMAFNDVVCPAGWVVADGTNGVPDLRGEFVRGLDMSRGVDTGRILGTSQKASLLAGGSNTYGASFYSTATKKSEWVNNGLESGLLPGSYITGSTYTYMGIASNAMATQTVGFMDNLQLVATVRPRNVALLYCMKISESPASQSNSGTWMNIDGTSSGRVVLGTTGNVGVGTNTPTEKLEVAGSIKMVDGNQGAGKVLVSDSAGKGTWKEMPGDLPTGTVMAFNDVACPAGWAIADGTNGTPDLRGEFVRGLDMGKDTDPGRVLGSQQRGSLVMLPTDADINTYILRTNGTAELAGKIYYDKSEYDPTFAYKFNRITTAAQTNWAAGTWNHNFVGATRPRNVALLYCMKISESPASQSNSGTWMNIDGTSSGRVVLGTTGNVGVGTNTPTEKLEVAGSIKMVDGNQGVGKVLVSDAVGKGTWQDMPGDLPIGTVMAFNDVACPSGWVIADGTSGTPDLRGEFVRGLDMGRGIDTGRVLGTAQSGSIYYGFPDATVGWNMSELSRSTLTNLGWEPITGSRSVTYRGAAGGVSANGAYTMTNAEGAMVRPRNVALLYCMKVTVASPELSNNVTWMNVDGTSSGRVSLATTGNVGVGTATPTEKLEVAGSIKIVDGNQGAGKVLISDAVGKGTWQEMPGDLPIGTVMAFNNVACPAGWAIADGTSGTPDLRGEFVRGYDPNYTGTGRQVSQSNTGVSTAIGSWQDEDWKGFYMRNTVQNGTAYAHENVNMGKSTTAYVGNIFAGYWQAPSAAIGMKWDNTSEIRPRNIALLYCMKISAAPPSMSDSTTWMNLDGTSSGRVVLSTTGNVGVGTNTPGVKLQVDGGIRALGGSTFGGANGYTFSSPGDTDGGMFSPADGTVLFATNNVERVRIASNGNVGIGASSPGAKLDVTGSTRTTSLEVMDAGTPTISLHRVGTYATQIKLNGSNQVSFGGWSAGEGQAAVLAGAFYYGSDRRLKEDIVPLKNTLEKVLSLNGYSFNWKKDGRKDIGVIAQEIEQVFPELVSTNPETGMKSVQYGNLVAPIIEAIKELAAQVKSLHTLIEEQQSDIRRLQSENAELRDRLNAIEAKLGQ